MGCFLLFVENESHFATHKKILRARTAVCCCDHVPVFTTLFHNTVQQHPPVQPFIHNPTPHFHTYIHGLRYQQWSHRSTASRDCRGHSAIRLLRVPGWWGPRFESHPAPLPQDHSERALCDRPVHGLCLYARCVCRVLVFVSACVCLRASFLLLSNGTSYTTGRSAFCLTLLPVVFVYCGS